MQDNVNANGTANAGDLDEQALFLHRHPRPGKLEIQPTKPLGNQRDLALAYSPGVAAPCLAIRDDPSTAADSKNVKAGNHGLLEALDRVLTIQGMQHARVKIDYYEAVLVVLGAEQIFATTNTDQQPG